MKNQYKYLLLLITGPLIIFMSSLFQHIVPPATGEYHYSLFFGKNYTLPVAIIFFVIGFVIGYYLNLNPWLTGLCLFLIFPLTSIIEAIVYPGSHNLIPFEFAIFFVYALPAIIGVYIGRFIRKQAVKRKLNTVDKLAN